MNFNQLNYKQPSHLVDLHLFSERKSDDPEKLQTDKYENPTV